MTDRRAWGAVALGGYFACIVLANYSIQHWGQVQFPGGPHTVTILGLTAPSGVLFVGLSFTLRDWAQLCVGRWPILVAIVAGAALSWVIAPSLALASGLGFLVGEACDWAAWTPLADRGRFTLALVLSNTAGAALDTLVFLSVAFDSLDLFWGQFWLKLLMTLPALAVVIPLRIRARVAWSSIPDQPAGAVERQRQKLIAGEDYGLDREALTALLLWHSLCPVHRWDYAICFDDEPPDCTQVRFIHPGHDS